VLSFGLSLKFTGVIAYIIHLTLRLNPLFIQSLMTDNCKIVCLVGYKDNKDREV
jgi:hypothetical protein